MADYIRELERMDLTELETEKLREEIREIRWKMKK